MSEHPDGDETLQTLSDEPLQVPPTVAPPLAPEATLAPVTLAGSLEHPPGAPAPGRGRLGRYEVHGEIGRGGMGAVLRGQDAVLRRPLALKVLLAERKSDPEAVRRFHEEAQIGGQLQHPGLVPVYELGTHEGVPFFAMKLVDGETLATLLRQRSSPADNLTRFLTVFEQICQAVGYAHARRVVHRDLKPANIMVGAFGEVQVMDWGLAKVLGEPSRSVAPSSPVRETMVRTARTESADAESHAGSILGTPAYMAPEQARGEVDQLDTRADVFGLGAILCEILTGAPPFRGKDVTEVLGKAARGDLGDVFTRLNESGADPELIALARTCLAPEPGDRPADGGTVAFRVADYRAGVQDRLRAAELERARAEARAVEERRRRGTQRALAGVVVLTLTLVGGGAWWVRQQALAHLAEEARLADEQKRTAAERDRRVEEDLERAEQALRRSAWVEADADLERADARLSGVPPGPLHERLGRARADRAFALQLEDAWLAYTASSVFCGNRPEARAGLQREASDRLFQEAFDRRGWPTAGDPEALAGLVRASPVHGPAVAGLDRWSRVKRGLGQAAADFLEAAVDRADPDPWRGQVRGAVRRHDRPALEALGADTETLRRQSAASMLFLGEVLLEGNRTTIVQRAIVPLSGAHARQPGDFWTNMALGHAWYLSVPLNTSHATPYYQSAVALRPDSAGAHYHLAASYVTSGTLLQNQAENSYREAIRLRPTHLWAHCDLADLLAKQGRTEEALKEYRTAIDLAPGLLEVRYALGSLLRDQGRLADAEAELRAAVRVNPADPTARAELGLTLQRLGRHADIPDALRGPAPDGPEARRRMWTRWTSEAQRARQRKQYAEAVGLYADVFAFWPEAAEDRLAGHRYLAACSGVLAAGSEAGRGDLRRQALAWLQADLASWERLASEKPPDRVKTRLEMVRWQMEPELAAVRGAALAKLPEGERADWRQFWEGVEAVRMKTSLLG